MKHRVPLGWSLLLVGGLLGGGTLPAPSAAPAKSRVDWNAVLGGKRSDTESALGKPVKSGVSEGDNPLEWTQYRLSGTKGLRQFWTSNGQLVETHIILGKTATWQDGVKTLGFNPTAMKLSANSPEQKATGSGQIVKDPIKHFNLHFKGPQDPDERFGADCRDSPVLWFEARSINDHSPD